MAGLFIQQQITVDLVRADNQIVALGDGVDGEQLLAGEDGTPRILRVAQQQQVGGGSLALQLLEIQHPASGLLHHGDGQQGAIVEARRLQEGVIDRLGSDDATAVLAPGLAGEVQTGHHPRQEDQPLGGYGPAIALLQTGDDEFDQPGGGAGIAEDAVGHPRGEGLDDGGGRGEVGVGYPHGQYILTLVLVPLQAHGAAAIYLPIKIKHVKSLYWPEGLPMYGLGPGLASLEVAVDNRIK